VFTIYVGDHCTLALDVAGTLAESWVARCHLVRTSPVFAAPNPSRQPSLHHVQTWRTTGCQLRGKPRGSTWTDCADLVQASDANVAFRERIDRIHVRRARELSSIIMPCGQSGERLLAFGE